MEKRVLFAVCLLIAVSALTGVLYQTGDVPTDETVTRLEIDSEGDAVFVLKVITVLDTDEKSAAFDSFAAEVENGSDPASNFRDSVEPLVERASNETGREMSASDFTVETRTEPIPEERGVVEYSFDWVGFARTSGEELRAGDVLSGYILSDGDALVLEAPDGYVVSSAEPTPDRTGEEARWNGPYDFAADEPRVVFTPEEPNATDTEGDDRTGETEDGQGTATDGGEADEANDDNSETEGTGFPLYVYAVALVVFISVVAAVYHARTDEETDVSAEEVRTQEAAEEDTVEEPESDDELILSMIESEGGRMKQKHVVEETGWSEAKVSKLTSRMEDEGTLTKIRLGRENILELSDEEDEENENPPV